MAIAIGLSIAAVLISNRLFEVSLRRNKPIYQILGYSVYLVPFIWVAIKYLL